MWKALVKEFDPFFKGFCTVRRSNQKVKPSQSNETLVGYFYFQPKFCEITTREFCEKMEKVNGH